MHDGYYIKEATLSKRQKRANALLVNDSSISNFSSNNTVRLDLYQKPQKTQQRPINLIPKSLSQETYIDLLTDPKIGRAHV